MVDNDDNPRDKIRALIGTSQNDPDANARQQAGIDLENFSRNRDVLKVIIAIALNDPDPTTRQQALKILDKLPSTADVIDFLHVIKMDDPDPVIGKFVLKKAAELMTSAVRNATGTASPYFRDSPMPIVAGSIYAHNHDRSKLLNLSPYLMSPRNKAYLSGAVAQPLPKRDSWWILAWCGLLVLVVAIGSGLVNKRPNVTILETFSGVNGLLIVLALAVVLSLTYFWMNARWNKQRARYAQMSVSGKLVVGHIKNTTTLLTGYYRSRRIEQYLNYEFLTPEGYPTPDKYKVSDFQISDLRRHGIPHHQITVQYNLAQALDEPDTALTVVILYENYNTFDLL